MDKDLQARFKEIFKAQPLSMYFSPGRVNLIGEHTDYSGGYVFPMGISLGIYGLLRPRDDQKIRVYSSNFDKLGILEIDLADLSYKKGFSYGNYIQGVLWVLKTQNLTINKGFDLYIHATLPSSAGLSSSAALEMLMLAILDDLNGYHLDDLSKVQLAKRVENEYMNVSSGIMDQYAVQFAKAGYALFLNTHQLTHAYAPMDFDKLQLVMMNTNKPRNLETSDYNERFSSVKKGTEMLQKYHAFDVLGQLDEETFNTLKKHLKDAKIVKRLSHVVSENARTKQSFEALKAHDYTRFAELMNGSHQSLRDDFEVSCAELDFLVEENRALGALGARMTGAGFGGTMIALYDKAHYPQSFERLKSAYRKRFNRALDIYPTNPSDGVKKVTEEGVE